MGIYIYIYIYAYNQQNLGNRPNEHGDVHISLRNWLATHMFGEFSMCIYIYVYISFLQLLVMVMKYNWETHSNKLLPWFQSFRQSIDAQEPITSPDVRSAGRVSAQLKPSMAGKSWRIHQDFDDFSHSDVIYRGFSMDFPTFIYFYPISSYDLPIKKKNLLDDSKKTPCDPAPGSLRLEWPAVSSAQVDDALSVSQSIGSIGSLRLNTSIYIYIILYYKYYNDTYI